jgi:HEAT repeat protein
MARDKRPAVRETAIYLLGIIGSFAATPVLMDALYDPVPAVRLQAAKALGRVGDPTAIPALLNALRGADEQLGSNIFSALVRMGHEAVPALIERSTSSSAWMRWNCLRALSEISDHRALPVLVSALLDSDHSVVWMAAKGLVRFGRVGLGPLLRLLITNETHPWLVETTSYVMRELYLRDPKLKSYLEPVIHSMHGPAFRVATPLAAQKALAQLTADGLVQA